MDAALFVLGTPAGPATVSTLREAEVFGAPGITDLLYAVCISPQKLAQVTRLRQHGIDLKIILDRLRSPNPSPGMQHKPPIRIPVLIEIDVDDHRSGVPWETAKH